MERPGIFGMMDRAGSPETEHAKSRSLDTRPAVRLREVQHTQRAELKYPPIDSAAYFVEGLKYGDMMIMASELLALKGDNKLETQEDFASLLHSWAVERKNKFLSEWRAENGIAEPVGAESTLQPD